MPAPTHSQPPAAGEAAHTPTLTDALGAIANARRINERPYKSALETAADIDGFLSTAAHKVEAACNSHAALVEALSAFEQGPPDGDNTDRWFAQYALNLEYARAALASATQ